MRKKVWSIGLMICLLLGMWVQAPQAQETQTESDYAGRARALMSALERNDYIPQEGETVTRAQFTRYPDGSIRLRHGGGGGYIPL